MNSLLRKQSSSARRVRYLRSVSEQHAIAREHIDRIRSNLTDDRRRAILGIKHVVAHNPQYRTEISSVDIYEAVLERGVTDLEVF